MCAAWNIERAGAAGEDRREEARGRLTVQETVRALCSALRWLELPEFCL